MLFKIPNKILTEDVQKTYLTAASAAASATITVKDITGFGIGDYIVIGEIGEEGTELIRVHTSTAPSGTTITLNANTVFPHAIDTPVYRPDYNCIEVSRATTLTGTKTVLTNSTAITPSSDYTYYEDTANTTGYGFVRLYNSSDTTASNYSGGTNYEYSGTYSSFDRHTLGRMTQRVRRHLSENPEVSNVTDDDIRDAINSKQEEIYQKRHWSFAEGEGSQSLIEDQFAYDIPSILDGDRIQYAVNDTELLKPVQNYKWKELHFDSDTESNSISHFKVSKGQICIFPRPAGYNYRFIVDSEVIYATGLTDTTFTGCTRGEEETTAATHLTGAALTERSTAATATTLNGALTAAATTITVASTAGFTKFAVASTAINDASDISATDTTITVDSTDDFKRGDYYRLKIDNEIIYATEITDTTFTGCLRGREGTTAAAHTDNTVVMELTLVVVGQLKPVDLFLSSDRTLIPKPAVLEYGAAMDIAYGTLKDNALGDRMKVLHAEALLALERDYAMKEYGSFTRIKDKYERFHETPGTLNSNNYPTSINT